MRLFDSIAQRLGYTPLVTEYASRYANPNNLAVTTLEDWLGALPDYIAATRANANTIGTVVSCRNTVTMLSRLDLYVERRGLRNDTLLPWLGRPEVGTPLATTLQWTLDDLFYYPASWWLVTGRDAYGWPTTFERIDRSRATFDTTGNLTMVDMKPVAPADTIRFDSPLGEGFLNTASRDIKRAIALNMSAALAEDNPVPTVELHNESGIELNQTEIDDLLEAWSSARRKRGVAYTPKGIKVNTYGQQPQQLLIDGRKQISIDLIRHANMPAWAASTAIDGGDMNYENRASRNWELLDLVLSSFATAITGRLSMTDITPRGWNIKFDLEQLTRPAQLERFQAYEIGKRAGFIDNAWIQAQEGWASVPAEGNPE